MLFPAKPADGQRLKLQSESSFPVTDAEVRFKPVHPVIVMALVRGRWQTFSLFNSPPGGKSLSPGGEADVNGKAAFHRSKYFLRKYAGAQLQAWQ